MYNLIAHRGQNSKKYKENTQEAITNSLKPPYIKGIEIDVRLTKDNKLVVIHDMTINRTSTGSGFVKNETLKTLKKHNYGTKENPSTISTLKEILKNYPNDKILLIEIKHETKNINKFIKYFYNEIKNFKNKKLYIMSFNPKIIKTLKEKHPTLKCGILTSTIINSKVNEENLDFIATSSYNTEKLKTNKKPTFIWAIKTKKKYLELKNKTINPNTYYIVDFPKEYI